MSLNDRTPESRKYSSYRYVYESGTLSQPTEGEWRGFDEEWQALQYMDESRLVDQAAANESGEPITVQVVDTHSTGKDFIVAFSIIRPQLVEPSRPVFAGHLDRPAHGELGLVSMLNKMKKKGAV